MKALHKKMNPLQGSIITFLAILFLSLNVFAISISSGQTYRLDMTFETRLAAQEFAQALKDAERDKIEMKLLDNGNWIVYWNEVA